MYVVYGHPPVLSILGQWRVREASALAINDVLSGRDAALLRPVHSSIRAPLFAARTLRRHLYEFPVSL